MLFFLPCLQEDALPNSSPPDLPMTRAPKSLYGSVNLLSLRPDQAVICCICARGLGPTSVRCWVGSSVSEKSQGSQKSRLTLTNFNGPKIIALFNFWFYCLMVLTRPYIFLFLIIVFFKSILNKRIIKISQLFWKVSSKARSHVVRHF